MNTTVEDNKKRERNLATVRRWYHNNSDGYNETRRERYATDDELREKAKERARLYRARRREGLKIDGEPMYREVNASGPCPEGRGVRVPVYTTGQIAQVLKCTPQMLRNWEVKKGWLPPSIFPDKHRLYTEKQKDLIIELAEFMKTYRRSPKAHQDALQELIKKVKAQWSDL